METFQNVIRYPGQSSTPCGHPHSNKTAAWLSLGLLIDDYEKHGYTVMQFPSNPHLFLVSDSVESFQLEMLVVNTPADARTTLFLDFGISDDDPTEPIVTIVDKAAQS